MNEEITLNYTCEYIALMSFNNQKNNLNKAINDLLEIQNIPISIITNENNNLFKSINNSKQYKSSKLECVIIIIKYNKPYEAL